MLLHQTMGPFLSAGGGGGETTEETLKPAGARSDLLPACMETSGKLWMSLRTEAKLTLSNPSHFGSSLIDFYGFPLSHLLGI